MSIQIISAHVLVESRVDEADEQISEAMEKIVADIYGHRPDWLRFSPGTRFVRGGTVFREFVCVAGSVAARIIQRAGRDGGLSRAIIYRAAVEGVERTHEIRAGCETEFCPDELRVL